jgi:DHA1 family multidrug resistance protein-like MFS transporter
MLDIFRDSTVGLIINTVSNGKLLPYADQEPRWKLPPDLQGGTPTSSVSEGKQKHGPETTLRPSDDVEKALPMYSPFADPAASTQKARDTDRNSLTSLKKQEGEASVYEVAPSSDESPHVLVGWYNENDQDNPQYVF